VTGALPYEWVVAPLSVAIVLLCAAPGSKQRLAGYLGGVSYPLYLNHWFGLFVGHSIAKRGGFEHSPAGLLLGVVLAYGFSAGLYWLVDRKVLAHRNAWYSPRIGRTVTIAAYGTIALGCAAAAVL
jgi:peptidoglycan/LPS O-acetylase OafA/YrhL